MNLWCSCLQILMKIIWFKLRTTDQCALAAHHNPVVSSWACLNSHWLAKSWSPCWCPWLTGWETDKATQWSDVGPNKWDMKFRRYRRHNTQPHSATLSVPFSSQMVCILVFQGGSVLFQVLPKFLHWHTFLAQALSLATQPIKDNCSVELAGCRWKVGLRASKRKPSCSPK